MEEIFSLSEEKKSIFWSEVGKVQLKSSEIMKLKKWSFFMPHLQLSTSSLTIWCYNKKMAFIKKWKDISIFWSAQVIDWIISMKVFRFKPWSWGVAFQLIYFISSFFKTLDDILSYWFLIFTNISQVGTCWKLVINLPPIPWLLCWLRIFW